MSKQQLSSWWHSRSQEQIPLVPTEQSLLALVRQQLVKSSSMQDPGGSLIIPFDQLAKRSTALQFNTLHRMCMGMPPRKLRLLKTFPKVDSKAIFESHLLLTLHTRLDVPTD